MKITIQNINTILEPVAEADAAGICELRNNPSVNKFLSNSNSVSVEEQVRWIKTNEAKKDGFYFKIVDKMAQKFTGTISLYNIDNKKNEAEFGRYICTNSLQAIEAELLIIWFGFEVMRLQKIYCRTANDNKMVWNQHYKFGFADAGFENFESKNLLLRKQELTKEQFDQFNYNSIQKLIERFAK